MSTKFSQFANGVVPRITDVLVGLRGSTNEKYTFSGINDSAGQPIVLWAEGAGNNVNYIQIQNNPTGVAPVISALGSDTNVNLNLAPKGAGIVKINATSAFGLPIGTTAQRPSSPSVGELRWNTTVGFAEIWDGSAWIEIGSGSGTLTQVNGTTNQIDSVEAAGVVTLSLSSTLVAPGTVRVGNILINTNTISSQNTNGNINIIPNGVGLVVLSNAQVGNLTPSRAIATDGSSNLVSSLTTATELGYLQGATSNIQAQINAIAAGGISAVNGTANQIAASTLAGVVTLSLPSAVIMPGTLTLNADPVTALQAATKQYVDSIASGFNFQSPCRLATTANLNATYNNGASGVGATLTNAGANAAFTADGTSASLNDRILVKSQSSTPTNGIYTVTTVGDGSTPWVLTRATDYDTAGEIAPGDFILVTAGATLINTAWLETATVATIGTDPIVFSQFVLATGAVMNVTASAPLASSGGQSPDISLTGTVPVANGGTGNTTFTAYSVICAGITATGAFQHVSGVGTTGQILTSNGAAALPTWQDAPAIDSDSLKRTVTQSGHGFSVGQVVYLNSSTYTLAIGTSAAAAEVVGMVTSVVDVNNFELTEYGYVTGLSGLTAGVVNYLSTTVAGALQSSAPTGVGEVEKPLLIADSTTSGYFVNMRGNIITANAGVPAASQAEMETASSTTTYVSPGRQQYHPGHPKAWIRYTETTTTAIVSSYNVTSVTDGGTGITTVTFTTSFSNTNYAFVATSQYDTNSSNKFTDFIKATNIATGSTQFLTHNGSIAQDADISDVSFFGDQ